MNDTPDPTPDAFAELLGRPRRSGSFSLAYDPAAHRTWSEVTQRANVARMTAQRAKAEPDRRRLEAEADELEEEVESLRASLGVVTFHFQQIPPKDYERLTHEHPATKDQRAEHRKGGGEGNLVVNPETFPAALAEACITRIVLPSGNEMKGITAAQFEALSTANYSDTELDRLFTALVTVNRSASTVEDVGKG